MRADRTPHTDRPAPARSSVHPKGRVAGFLIPRPAGAWGCGCRQEGLAQAVAARAEQWRSGPPSLRTRPYPATGGPASCLLPDLGQPPLSEPSTISRSVHSWIRPHRPPGAVILPVGAAKPAAVRGRQEHSDRAWPGGCQVCSWQSLLEPPTPLPPHAGGTVLMEIRRLGRQLPHHRVPPRALGR